MYLRCDLCELLETAEHVVEQLELPLRQRRLRQFPGGAAVLDQQRDVLQLQPPAPRQVVHHAAAPVGILCAHPATKHALQTAGGNRSW